MRLYLLAFFLMFSCKWTEPSSKQATAKKQEAEVTRSLTLSNTDHPPIPEARPSAIEMLKSEVNDETKKAKRAALKAALDRRLQSEDMKGLQAEIDAAQASSAASVDSLETILDDVKVDISFHVVQAPHYFETITNASKNLPAVDSKDWNAGGRIPVALLEEQAQRLIKAFSDVINFTFTSSKHFAYRYVTGAAEKDGECYNGEAMICFPDQSLYRPNSCPYVHCFNRLFVPENNMYSQHYVSDPPVPAQMYGVWPLRINTIQDEQAAWWRFAGRVMLSELGGALAPGAADPLHLNVIVSAIHPMDPTDGRVTMWPWAYAYPLTYPPVSGDSDVWLLDEPKDKNLKSFPPDSVWVNYKKFSDVNYMVGEDNNRNNVGGALIHETGHWLGLHHTFAGTDAIKIESTGKYHCQVGCGVDGGPMPPIGDEVEDTVVSAYTLRDGTSHPSHQYGNCNDSTTNPEGPFVDTCQDFAGIDPQMNFMNYTSDTCRFKEGNSRVSFTPGQRQRMLEWLAVRVVKHTDVYLPNIPTTNAQAAGTAAPADAEGDAIVKAYLEMHGKANIERYLRAQREALTNSQNSESIDASDLTKAEARVNENQAITAEIASIDAALANLDMTTHAFQRASLTRLATNIATVDRLEKWLVDPYKYRVMLPMISTPPSLCNPQ